MLGSLVSFIYISVSLAQPIYNVETAFLKAFVYSPLNITLHIFLLALFPFSVDMTETGDVSTIRDVRGAEEKNPSITLGSHGI